MLVIGDCLQRRYAFASIDLFDQAGKSVYHSLFQLQDFQWKFQPAPDGSMGGHAGCGLQARARATLTNA